MFCIFLPDLKPCSVILNGRRGIVVMDFDCYSGDRGWILAHGDSLGKWMNLRLDQPMPCEGNWVDNPRCWRDIDLQSVYNCENGLLSLLQFNHIKIEIELTMDLFIIMIILGCVNYQSTFQFGITIIKVIKMNFSMHEIDWLDFSKQDIKGFKIMKKLIIVSLGDHRKNTSVRVPRDIRKGRWSGKNPGFLCFLVLSAGVK